VPMSELGN